MSTVYSSIGSIVRAFSPTSSVARVICSHGKMFRVWCREVSANGEDKPLRAKSEDEENAHVQCFDYIFDYIRFALSNFRVSFHVCSCLFMSARGAPKSLHIPLGPGRSATLAAACSWKGLHWTVQRIPSYSGHLEGASPTSSNHDEPLPGKSLQAFVCLIILMTFRF